MGQSFKRAALTAVAIATIASPLSAAEAPNGYAYLFWPLLTTSPDPAKIQTQAAAPAPIASTRRAPAEYIHEAADIRYARSAEGPRAPAAAQAIILGVGF